MDELSIPRDIETWLILSRSVLSGPDDLPGFWIFMYRVNPFTYVIEGLLGTSLANVLVTCSPNELIELAAPSGSTCDEYLGDYISPAGGYLSDPDSSDCSSCPLEDTNDFLAGISVNFGNR